MTKNRTALESLSDNVTHFFHRFEQKFKNSMKCAQGCSACCYTDLSVFPVEAQRIVDWFHCLSSSEQANLKNSWQTPVKEGACAFLYQDSCTIYDVRPIICRSHGVLVKVDDEYDICPLNETEETTAACKDALDLNRLNTLLSVAQRSTLKNDDRIALKSLKEDLLFS